MTPFWRTPPPTNQDLVHARLNRADPSEMDMRYLLGYLAQTAPAQLDKALDALEVRKMEAGQ